MNRLSQLMRPALQQPPMRKKWSGINMAKRKEMRRLKKINTFSRQFTGQQNQHGWFTPKRYKALGVFIENSRNVHPGFLPIKPELKKEIGEKFVEDSHWEYFNFRNQYSQYLKQVEMHEGIAEEELAQLPAHFREQFKKVEEGEEMPKIVNILLTHNEQYNVFMPQDERQRINLLMKIDNPPLSKEEEE